MKVIPDAITQLAFDNKEGEFLTKEQQTICDEWNSGSALEYMKIDVGDPRLLEYLALYIECENKKAALWKRVNNQ